MRKRQREEGGAARVRVSGEGFNHDLMEWIHDRWRVGIGWLPFSLPWTYSYSQRKKKGWIFARNPLGLFFYIFFSKTA